MDAGEFLSALAGWNLFETTNVTAQDADRVKAYKTDVERKQLRTQFSDLGSYLESLDMEAEVRRFDSMSLPRVLQLVQRSNQFNLTTIRHSEQALRDFAADQDVSSFTIRLRDRLGDNGIVVAIIAEKKSDDLVINTWIMSCRVLGRKVEELTAGLLVDEARRLGCRHLIGQYLRTPKNDMVSDLYPRMGFERIEPDGDTECFSLDTEHYTKIDVPIRVDLPMEE